MALSDDLRARLQALFDSCDAAPQTLDGTAPRIVVDTNVLLDLTYWEDPVAAGLKAAIDEGRFIPVLSSATMMEWGDVLTRQNFLGESEDAAQTIEATIRGWVKRFEWVRVTEADDARVPVQCKDPLDQKFLVLAVASHAQALLTKDKLVLKAGRRLKAMGCTPYTPADFNRKVLNA